MPERTNISEIIEIGSCKLTVDVVSGRAKGVRRTAYLRPLRLCPDGMIGIVLNDRIYPVLLDAKKQFIIHDQGASFAAKNGKVPKIPGVFEVKFGEIPDSWALTKEDIDEAIADSLEHLTGFRPKSWCLFCFDDTLETV